MSRYLIHKVICLTLVFFISAAEAQITKPGITFGGHVMYSNPKGSFADAYKYGIGSEIFGGIGLAKTFIVATVGLSKFHPVSGTQQGTLTYTPVKIGVKHFIFRKMLFLNADIGKAIVKNKSFNESQFTRGVGVGAKLLGLEVGLYYDGWKNVKAPGSANSVNFKIGWSISL